MSQEIQTILAELKGALPGFDTKFSALERRIDEMEVKGSRFASGQVTRDPIREAFEASGEMKLFRNGERKAVRVVVKDLAPDLKTAITSTTVGSGTAGALMPQKIDGIVTAAQRRNFMRDILPTKTTQNNAVYFIKELAFTNAASPQVEASAKGESALTVTTDTALVRTIAHWLPVSKQVADDFEELMLFIRTKLIYGYLLVEDRQVLLGDGTGNNLSGLVTEATAFNTGLLSASSGWKKVDLLRRAIQQVEMADEAATGWFVLSPTDWADIELLKDADGNYICGDPRSMMAPTLWGKPVAVTTAMTTGKFLAGSNEAADLRIRQDITIDISESHGTFFIENMLCVRCEGRVAMPVYKPGALIQGTFNTSPAS